MTPEEGYEETQRIIARAGCDVATAKVLSGMTDELLEHRVEGGIKKMKDGESLRKFFHLTIPEIERRPSMVHLVVSLKLRGLL